MEDFEQLLCCYDGLIRKAIRHMRIYQNFEEFYQIGCIALWQAQQTYDKERCAFEKYAFLMIKYALSKELTRQTKERVVLLTEQSDLFEHVVRAEETLCTEWLGELLLEEQQLLHFVYVLGYTSREIAQRLQLTEEAVKKRRQRLLRKLRAKGKAFMK